MVDTEKEEGSRHSLERIKGEIIEFFASNPFVLVSRDWLASLVCRPMRLVEEAISELLAEGHLEVRNREVLLGLRERGEVLPRTTREEEGNRHSPSPR